MVVIAKLMVLVHFVLEEVDTCQTETTSYDVVFFVLTIKVEE